MPRDIDSVSQVVLSIPLMLNILTVLFNYEDDLRVCKCRFLQAILRGKSCYGIATLSYYVVDKREFFHTNGPSTRTTLSHESIRFANYRAM